MKRLDPRGEGPLMPVLFLVILGALAYAGYVYLWPMVAGTDKPSQQTSSTDPTPTPETKGTLAGSPAAQQVQGAQAAGELMGSGR